MPRVTESSRVLGSVAMRLRRPTASEVVLGLLCLMYLITYVDRVNIATAASEIKRDMTLSNTQLAFVLSAFGYPYIVFQIFGGWLGDRVGPRRTLFVCGLVWSSATILTGFAGGLASLFLVRLLIGVGEGATFPVATRAMHSWTSPDRRGFAQGLTHAFSRLGNALTPPIVAWLIGVVTWRGSFVLLGCASLVWVVTWVWYFRDVPVEHGAITEAELERLPNRGRRPDASGRGAAGPVPWRRLAARMWPVAAVYFCYGWTLWMYLNWLPSYFLHEHSLQLGRSALFSSAVFSAGVGGDYLGGVISDAILRRTGDIRKARCHLVLWAFLASFLCVLPIFSDPRSDDRRVEPGRGLLLRRDRHRTHVGDSDGHRATLPGHRERLHEHRVGARGRALAAGVRPHHRRDRKLEPPVRGLDGAPPHRRRADLDDAAGVAVRAGGRTGPAAAHRLELGARPRRPALGEEGRDALAKVAARVAHRDEIAILARGQASRRHDAANHLLRRSHGERRVRGNL